MQASDFTRTDCIVGAKRISYKRLTRYFVCNDCGGRIVVLYDKGYYAACGACNGQDFVSERTYNQQIVEAWEVKRGLPERLRALLDDTPTVTTEEAIADLYG